MAPISTISAEDGKVSCETAEGTVININITQRSALDCLLDTIRTLRAMKRPGAKPTRGCGSAAGMGVSLMSLGCLCIMLAVILCVVRPQQAVFYTGMHFWVGIPFIISGVLNVVSYRYPKACWEILAFVSLLVSFGVSIGGMVCLVNDITYFYWNGLNYICEQIRNPGGYGYVVTKPPGSYDMSYQYVEYCKEQLLALQKLVYGVIMMSLLMMVWGLCVSLVSLGCRMKSFCCAREISTDEKHQSLLSENASGRITIT